MKLLAVVLARKNSRRLKNKHHLLINNKRMINHTFDLLKNMKKFHDIVISTDDEKILAIAKKYKKFIILKRPKNLALDKTKSYKVIRHAYYWYKKKYGNIDGIFVLQPTSPLRKITTINKMIKLFKTNKMKRSIVSVSPAKEYPDWMLKIKNNSIIPYTNFNKFSSTSQKLTKLYRINGLGYLISSRDLVKERTLIPKKSVPIVNLSSYENIDIDTREDLIKARLFYNLA